MAEGETHGSFRGGAVPRLVLLSAASLAVMLLAMSGVRLLNPGHACGPYPDWRTSDYALPFPAGDSYRVTQGNCTGGHLTNEAGALRHSYDFDMPIGSVIAASRSGRVVYARTHFRDGNGGGPVGSDNVLLVEHRDGSFALYGHLTFGGALVEVGDYVARGQPVALSGNTGMTGGLPHLHFMVSTCPDGRIPCGYDRTSIPVTFRNTRANPGGPATGEVYEAFAAGEE